MHKIHIIGCGSLGSCLALEIAKRSYALNFPLELHLYDDDNVEERNIAAQLFSPTDIGSDKVEAVGRALEAYNCPVELHKVRVNDESLPSLPIDMNDIIIDCVDNIDTRHFLWKLAFVKNCPVLHLGMSKTGTGLVSWNYDAIDTFNLSPTKVNLQKLKEHEAEDVSLPPCELNGFRHLILNTVLAGLNALFHLLGFDTTKEFSENPPQGIMSSWSTDTKSIKLIDEFLDLSEWPKDEQTKSEAE